MTRYLEIKPGSISETIKRLSDDYQAIFKKELEKTGKGIGSMTPDEKKAFFNKIDKMHNAKNEAMDSSWIKKEIDKEKKTTLVAAPGNKEKVIRIPKEKLADYKAKGYVEAESFVPEQAVNPYAVGMAAAMKATGDTPPLKKSTITKAHKIADKVKEEELTAGQKKLPPALQKAIEKKQKNEEVEINEITDEEEKNYGRQITSLSNDKVMARINKKGDAAIAAIQAKIDSIRDERNKKRDQKNEEVETVEEAAGANQLTNLNDKITRLQVNISKLDKSKPESKTKEAILKSDLTTAKLRLQDLMQKRNTETEKPMNEAKKTYKSIKKSVKKEEETPKKTMTDKPLTKIDVDPKITSN
jgi:hypothetical protein